MSYLRRYKVRGTLHHTNILRVTESSGQTKIHQFDVEAASSLTHNVLRLDIKVDNVLGVNVCQPCESFKR